MFNKAHFHQISWLEFHQFSHVWFSYSKDARLEAFIPLSYKKQVKSKFGHEIFGNKMKNIREKELNNGIWSC